MKAKGPEKSIFLRSKEKYFEGSFQWQIALSCSFNMSLGICKMQRRKSCMLNLGSQTPGPQLPAWTKTFVPLLDLEAGKPDKSGLDNEHLEVINVGGKQGAHLKCLGTTLARIDVKNKTEIEFLSNLLRGSWADMI